MAYRLASPNIQFNSQTGIPLAGGFLYFYITGTSTLAITYSDAALTQPNTNPIVLNSAGYAGSIFLDPVQLYKVTLTDSNNIQQWSLDPVSDPASGSQTIASALTISDGAGSSKSLILASGTLSRWALISDGTPETGSNAGSNFFLNSYDDSGAFLATIFNITRSTGVLNFSLPPTIGGVPLIAPGQIGMFPCTTPPSGWLGLNGTTFLRSTYPNLTAFALASSNIVSDATWLAGGVDGSFSSGDGSTTIRLPDYRGYFARAWDNSRGIDTGRALGTDQAHQLQDHAHNVTFNANPTGFSAGNSAGSVPGNSNVTNTTTVPVSGNHGAETRPENISALFCIKT